MHNWFDTEWDYGFAAGLYALIASTSLLESFEPAVLLPAHGPIVPEPKAELAAYQQKLRQLAPLYVRGYKIRTFDVADQDLVSRPAWCPISGKPPSICLSSKSPTGAISRCCWPIAAGR